MKTHAGKARLTPDQRKAYEHKEFKTKMRERRRIQAIQRCLSSQDGVELLRFIRDASGYQQSNVAADPQTGELYHLGLQHNEARRILYLQLRRFASREVLMRVEVDDTLQGERDEDELDFLL